MLFFFVLLSNSHGPLERLCLVGHISNDVVGRCWKRHFWKLLLLLLVHLVSPSNALIWTPQLNCPIGNVMNTLNSAIWQFKENAPHGISKFVTKWTFTSTWFSKYPCALLCWIRWGRGIQNSLHFVFQFKRSIRSFYHLLYWQQRHNSSQREE